MGSTRDALSDLRVRDVMVAQPVTVRPDMRLERFMDDVFLAHRHTAYPVLAADTGPVGMISFRHVAATPRAQWADRTVQDLMVPIDRVVVVSRDADLRDAYARLIGDDLHRAIVRDGQSFSGLLSLTDVARVIEAVVGVANGRGR